MSEQNAALYQVLKEVWGFESFRPHQLETIHAILSRQDSLTILPTGGGKSLCYQLPALCFPGQTAIIVSPLIALMKDQVDNARNLGIQADAFNSSFTSAEARAIWERFYKGETKLLYIAPERMTQPEFLENMRQSERISFFAIDEAHCISQWGHDFRPDYRMLSRIRQEFPETSVHAFTATATPQVQTDILNSLNLYQPACFTGNYDRPNLNYQVLPRAAGRENLVGSLARTIERYPNEAGIIYCISRNEVDQISLELKNRGYAALPYHAGLDDNVRRRNQESFMAEETDIIVATVAFGMGIDRSNIRYVIHTGMPKSLENYQQEAGRAGRDGLASDCILLHGAKDVTMWSQIIRQGSPEGQQVAMRKLEDMSSYCHSVVCRHRYLVEHFGQAYEGACGSQCDICQNVRPFFKDSLTVSQKILSCVWRVGQFQNTTYVQRVLCGSKDDRILQNGHDQLTTYGLLREYDKKDIRVWIDQLVGQKLLEREGPFTSLKLTPLGIQVLKGASQSVMLTDPVRESAFEGFDDNALPSMSKKSAGSARAKEMDGVDRKLFDLLRNKRKELAQEQRVPAFIIFGDQSLREMAREKPSTERAMLGIHGVGFKKFQQYGAIFLQEILQYGNDRIVLEDGDTSGEASGIKRHQLKATREIVFEKLDQGATIAEVAQEIGRMESTALKYLYEYLEERKVTEPSPWVSQSDYQEIVKATQETGSLKFRKVFDALSGEISYQSVCIGLTIMKNRLAAYSSV